MRSVSSSASCQLRSGWQSDVSPCLLNQGERAGRHFRADTCDLNIPAVRVDPIGRCLRYAGRDVFNRCLEEICELTEDPGGIRDPQVVLQPGRSTRLHRVTSFMEQHDHSSSSYAAAWMAG